MCFGTHLLLQAKRVTVHACTPAPALQVAELCAAIARWLSHQELSAEALAALLPTARRLAGTCVPGPGAAEPLLERRLLQAAAGQLGELVCCAAFLEGWAAEDVAALLQQACSDGAEVAVEAAAAIKMAHARVARDPSARCPHWPLLLDCLDFGQMTEADVEGVGEEVLGQQGQGNGGLDGEDSSAERRCWQECSKLLGERLKRCRFGEAAAEPAGDVS